MVRPIDDIMDEGDASNDDDEFPEGRTSKSRTSSELKGKRV